MASALTIPRISRGETLRPTLGMYLDRPAISVPKGGMTACKNVRVLDGDVTNRNMGWTPFFSVVLNGEVLLIDQLFTRAGSQTLIFGTLTDLYRFDEGSSTVLYITPTYNTGTVTVVDAATTVEGLGGMLWNTAKAVGQGNNAIAGYEIAFGASDEDDPTATWYTIASVTDDDTLELTAGHSGGVAGVAYTIRQKFTGTVLNIWSTETFPDAQPQDEDTWYATNGKDALVKWDGSDQTVSWYDPGFICRSILRHKDMMLYLDLTVSGERKNGSIRNSAIASPENVSTLEASEFKATDGVDTLLTAVPLGDAVVIYGERSINLVQFVGLPLNFVIRTAVPGVGTLSSRGVMDFGDFHEFIAADSAYSFDGVGIEEVGGQVFREVLRQLDPNRLDRLTSHIDEENGEVLWAVPLTTDATGTTGAPVTAYVTHYLENVGRAPTPVTIRDFPASATGFFQRASTFRFNDLTLGFDDYDFAWNDRFFSAAFPFNLFGDSSGNVFIFGTVGSQNGASIESFARFGRTALGDGKWKGIVKRIYPYTTRRPSADYTLGVLLWVADEVNGELSLAAQEEFDLTHAGNRFVTPRKAGRYGEVEFATTGANRTWSIAGYGIESVLGGER